MKLYVGNLSYEVGNIELKIVFEGFGYVESAVVITDKTTGKSRGFGFVDMPNAGEARQALERLNGQDLLDRPLKISEAAPEQAKPQGRNRDSFRAGAQSLTGAQSRGAKRPAAGGGDAKNLTRPTRKSVKTDRRGRP